MNTYLLVMLGGSLGALMRYSISAWASRQGFGPFPVGTVLVNLIGALGFGLLWAWSESWTYGAQWRLVLLTGGMGALTTFSTFVFEGVRLLEAGNLFHFWLNLLGQNSVGLLFVWGGLQLGRWLAAG